MGLRSHRVERGHVRSHGVRGHAHAHLENEPPEEPLHRAQDPPRVPVQLGVDHAGVGHVGGHRVTAGVQDALQL
jgi:hypothetical protein